MFIEHVNITVSDLRRSVDFYQQLLDLRVRWQGTTSTGVLAAHVGDDRSYVAMFQAERSEEIEIDYGRVGVNHFGFVVDDLDAMKSRLAELGVAPKAEADYDPGRRLYFLDPNGIEVELVSYDG